LPATTTRKRARKAPPPIDPALRGWVFDVIQQEPLSQNVKMWAEVEMFYMSIAPRFSNMQFGIGVDPGQRHMGLAVLAQDQAVAWQITWKDMPGRAFRASIIMHTIRYLIGKVRREAVRYDGLIEDAAGNARFGQAQLAEARTAAMIAVQESPLIRKLEVMPPMTWRKQLFGHGHIRAEEVWKDKLPGDAATAVALALLAAKLA